MSTGPVSSADMLDTATFRSLGLQAVPDVKASQVPARADLLTSLPAVSSAPSFMRGIDTVPYSTLPGYRYFYPYSAHITFKYYRAILSTSSTPCRVQHVTTWRPRELTNTRGPNYYVSPCSHSILAIDTSIIPGQSSKIEISIEAELHRFY